MKKNQSGFTLIELLIVVAIISIISAIAIPGLMKARMSGNESSAIGSLRAISSGQAAYESVNNGYATSLVILATGCQGSTTGFISSDLKPVGGDVTKAGYLIQNALTGATGQPGPTDCTAAGNATTSAYFARAEPVTVGKTGTRSFALASDGAIYYNNTGVNIAEGDIGSSATVKPLGR